MKMPWLKFFPGDWLKDPAVSLCSPSARGIWMDLLCAMHELDSGGKLVGTREQFARIARCSVEEMDKTLSELSVTKAANVSERNGVVTVVNRRMHRARKVREQTQLRVMKCRLKRSCNADETPLKHHGNAVDVRCQMSDSTERAYCSGKQGGKEREIARAKNTNEIETEDTCPSDAAQEPVIPTIEEVIAFGVGPPGIPADFCRHYHDVKTERQSWVTPQGKLVLWRNEIIRWWNQDRATWSKNHGSNTNRPNSRPNPRNAGVMGPPDIAQRIAAVAYRKNEESRKRSEARWAKVQEPVATTEPGAVVLPPDNPVDG